MTNYEKVIIEKNKNRWPLLEQVEVEDDHVTFIFKDGKIEAGYRVCRCEFDLMSCIIEAVDKINIKIINKYFKGVSK